MRIGLIFPAIIPPVPAATSVVPSDDDATDDQIAVGALVFVQVVPEFVEI
jgi:hypothetical protein